MLADTSDSNGKMRSCSRFEIRDETRSQSVRDSQRERDWYRERTVNTKATVYVHTCMQIVCIVTVYTHCCQCWCVSLHDKAERKSHWQSIIRMCQLPEVSDPVNEVASLPVIVVSINTSIDRYTSWTMRIFKHVCKIIVIVINNLTQYLTNSCLISSELNCVCITITVLVLLIVIYVSIGWLQ